MTSMTVSLSPPGMDETLFQSHLYFAFLRYLAPLKANENLVFVKRATVFSIARLPLREKYAAACKIIWDFFSDSCSSPVNVSAETRNNLLPVLFRRDGITRVKDDMFDQAISEIRLLMEPMFNAWIATGEWQKIPFFHAQPPSISVIIRLPSVRERFESFLKARCEGSKANKGAETECKMFKTCIELQELIDQSKAPGASKKDCETAARRYIRAHKSVLNSLPMMGALEMPNLQHKKKHSETPADAGAAAVDDASAAAAVEDSEAEQSGQPTCMDYVLDALDTLSEELTQRESYEHFTEEKTWNYVDVLKASLQQTTDEHGFVQFPTLAAILHAPTYGPLIMETLKGTAKNDQMRFLLEAQDFHRRFNTKAAHKLRSQSRKEMQIEARRIFDTFVAKNSIDVPKRVKSELLKIIHSPIGRMSSDLFQIAGSWVYNVIDRSWIREVNSMLLWADHDFDNNSPDAKDMEEQFNFSHLSHLLNENLFLVPHPDDVLGNPGLWDSFRKFVPASDFTNACFEFIRIARNIPNSPAEAQLLDCQTLLDLLKTISKESPGLAAYKEEIESHMMQDTRLFNPVAFMMPSFLVEKMLLVQYYNQWIVKCKLTYKMSAWVPVKKLTFVSNNAIPGTSWIPSIQLSNSDVSSKAMPTKKRWGLVSKIRGNSPVDRPVSPPESGHKRSASSSSSSSSSISVSQSPASQKTEDVSPNSVRRGSVASCEERGEPLPTTPEPQKQSAPIRLPSSVQKSIPVFNMEVPTMPETLGSSHLRRLFYATFLELRLGDDEKIVWKALCHFQDSFACLTDPEIAQRQGDIRAAAKKVLDENPSIPNRDELMKALNESSYPVSSRFFFNAEAKLYGHFHESYQSFLLNNHWVRH